MKPVCKKILTKGSVEIVESFFPLNTHNKMSFDTFETRLKTLMATLAVLLFLSLLCCCKGSQIKDDFFSDEYKIAEEEPEAERIPTCFSREVRAGNIAHFISFISSLTGTELGD